MKALLPIAALLAACAAPPAPPAPAPADDAPLHRVVAILEYVAADYGGAVQDGKVASEAEYEEQRSFVRTALEQAPAAERPLVAELQKLVEARAPAHDVAARARSARDAIVRAHGLQLAPAGRPSKERGAELYAVACVLCHGLDGKADTPRAKELDPRPVSYQDLERTAALTPYKAFNAVTFGLEGTAMASFQEALSAKDRWDLAFYVFTLRHAGAAATPPAEKPSLRTLATRSDAELGGSLAEVAWMRLWGAYQQEQDPFDTTRALLDRALGEKDRDRAHELVVDAYLQGFEPVEGRVRGRDAALVAEVERAFLDLRAEIRAGNDPAAAGKKLMALLDRAEDAAGEGGSDAGAVALAAAVIILREGLEAIFLIAVVLAALRRLERADLRRWVHAGWVAALPAGLATWLAAQALVGLFQNREAAEGWTSLAAAAILFYCGFWLHSQSETGRWLSFVKSRTSASAAALFLVAFLAVYRELAEVVLFFQSLLLGSSAGAGAVLGGIALGALLLSVVGALIFGLGNRLPSRAFFSATGAIMFFIAVIFTGKGIHALEIAGALRPHPLPVPDLPWVGFYGDALVAAAQAALIALFAVSTAARFGRRGGSTDVIRQGETP